MADVKDWQELTLLTQGAPLVVERVGWRTGTSSWRASSPCRSWRG